MEGLFGAVYLDEDFDSLANDELCSRMNCECFALALIALPSPHLLGSSDRLPGWFRVGLESFTGAESGSKSSKEIGTRLGLKSDRFLGSEIRH
jgi:hypothetical protein